MPVVVNADDLAFKNVFQLLEVDNKSGGRIHVTRHSNFQSVIMAVAVAIRASAEDAEVLLRRPRVIPVIVGGRKLGFAGEKYHEFTN
jgi:hypothetical protein